VAQRRPQWILQDGVEPVGTDDAVSTRCWDSVVMDTSRAMGDETWEFLGNDLWRGL
jgi:hypothetical protein